MHDRNSSHFFPKAGRSDAGAFLSFSKSRATAPLRDRYLMRNESSPGMSRTASISESALWRTFSISSVIESLPRIAEHPRVRDQEPANFTISENASGLRDARSDNTFRLIAISFLFSAAIRREYVVP